VIECLPSKYEALVPPRKEGSKKIIAPEVVPLTSRHTDLLEAQLKVPRYKILKEPIAPNLLRRIIRKTAAVC
jgi:hypothetical protein